MSQLSEIPASAYTPEMETFGALPDIPTFDGEPVPVSRNPLTPGTRPLQLLPLLVASRSWSSEEQLRDAATEMRGATSWLRGTSILGATYFKQLRDADVEWRGVSAEMRYAAVLLSVQLRQSYVTLIWARPARVDQPLMLPPCLLGFAGPAYASSGRRCRLRRLCYRIVPHAASFPAGYAICIDGAVERLHSHLHLRVRRDDPHTRGLCCHYRPSLHWPGSPTRCSISDGHSLGPAGPLLARCHHTDPVHRARVSSLGTFLDLDLPWIRACCFLLLNVYAMKNRQPGIEDFRLLTIVRDMQLYHHTVFMMIMGETMCWVRDIALHIIDFNVHHRGCPLLLQAWALDKLSLIPPVLARLISTYGAAIFQSRSRRCFDFGGNPTIRWTCPWWRIRLVTTTGHDRKISRQYGMIQRVPRVHNFESGLITPHLLTTLADRWRSRNTVYLDEGTMKDTVKPAYANWFFTP
ncbi:hypothetical protein JCGZ_23968 [Jatropha curcas]|uniref:Aminotransferase-like plant mobile domain-containing protein n=1 Tax=Jatropha curcas TaxID=180498 RepID=A0A067JSK8_JATCU|nr:hypothetical protein JCGZ_23968 [Jatropha curcas]